MMLKKVAVLGAGSWGMALAKVLCDNGKNVCIWSNMAPQVEALQKTRQNPGYLPGFLLPEKIEVTGDLSKAVTGADAVIVVVPSAAVRAVAQQLKSLLKPETVVVNAAKGFEKGTLLRLSQVLCQELPGQPVAVLSGPSHAEEVSKAMPTTIVAAAENHDLALVVQDLFINPYFRVYTNSDLLGVEISGAMKNIIALGAGMADGLGYGDNAEAALMTRGLAEIARLGMTMGAGLLTFAGLAGMGDLIVTCGSRHSRNRRAGVLIGKGVSLDQAVKEVGMVVEGVDATESGYRLAQKYGVEMPITETIYKVLFEGYPVEEAMLNLMTREKRREDLEGGLDHYISDDMRYLRS